MLTDAEFLEDVAFTFRSDRRFRAEWLRYEIRNALACAEYVRVTRTIDRRYGDAM